MLRKKKKKKKKKNCTLLFPKMRIFQKLNQVLSQAQKKGKMNPKKKKKRFKDSVSSASVLSQQPNRAKIMYMQNLKIISAFTSSDNAQSEEENDAAQVATQPGLVRAIRSNHAWVPLSL
jgi:hypothetical protein